MATMNQNNARYYAYYKTDEGTRPQSPVAVSTRLREAETEARKLALGNCLAGSRCRWYVYDELNNTSASGICSVSREGKVTWRTDKESSLLS